MPFHNYLAMYASVGCRLYDILLPKGVLLASQSSDSLILLHSLQSMWILPLQQLLYILLVIMANKDLLSVHYGSGNWIL